jgi:sarcosine oxidase subunit gamma
MLERASALASVIPGPGKAGVGGMRTLKLGELRGWSLLQIAGFVPTMAKVEARIAALTGVAVPENVRIPARSGETWVFRTAPAQIWIVGPEASDLEARAVRDIRPEEGAVTPLSHSRTRIFIEGPHAADTLKKGIPFDLSESFLAAGEAALTGIHHTPILLHRLSRERFELYSLRTFALTVWEWLADAAHEFGYEVAE